MTRKSLMLASIAAAVFASASIASAAAETDTQRKLKEGFTSLSTGDTTRTIRTLSTEIAPLYHDPALGDPNTTEPPKPL